MACRFCDNIQKSYRTKGFECCCSLDILSVFVAFLSVIGRAVYLPINRQLFLSLSLANSADGD